MVLHILFRLPAQYKQSIEDMFVQKLGTRTVARVGYT